jgi:RHS repeat-associated protein
LDCFTIKPNAENQLIQVDGTSGTCSSPAADYVYASGQLIAEYENSTTYFVHDNNLGSSTILTSLAGAVVDCNALYPYGEQDNTICTTSYSIWDKFTGYRLDPETGLEYAHARYYNPSLGRFMSPDPLGGNTGNPQSLNRYAYVLNSPLNFIDPFGLEDECSTFCSATVCLESCTNQTVVIVSDSLKLGGGYPVDQPPVMIYIGGKRGTWQTIKSIARKIGNYIPTVCGGGLFNYGGFRVSGDVASVSVSQIRMADTRSGYSEAPFTDISFGEELMGGYGQAVFSSGENEHFLFGGVGGDVGITKASVSLFGSHTTGSSILQNSIGLNGDAGFLAFAGGVGVYVNIDSLTSCADHGGW